MRKRALSVLLTSAMVAAMLTACGDNSNDGGTTNPTVDPDYKYTATTGGKVLNIWCWNDEFRQRVEQFYPDYEKVSDTEGKIGDVKVVWTKNTNDNNVYQNKLDEALEKQASAAADDKIDLFLVEADYALKYVDTTYTVPVTELGITSSDIADQYKYTQDVVTDSNGKLKGLSWQGCPGVMFYSREAAKEVFGTDDPAEIQEYFKDWDTFVSSAKTLDEKGYDVVSSVNDTFRVYSNNVTSPWVVDGVINIDDNIKKWVDDSKALVDAGYTGTHDLWLDDWKKGFYPEGKVFAYFGPAWLVNFSMAADVEGSIGYNGGWAAAEGPQGFFWGGTWMCACDGTDNADLIKDIMLKMTADADIAVSMVQQVDEFANNKTAMEAIASGETLVPVLDADGNPTGEEVEYSSKILGGQNPIALYCAGVANLDLSNLSAYDQGMNEEFQGAMKNYFDGAATYEEALDQFYKAVIEKYPELKKPE